MHTQCAYYVIHKTRLCSLCVPGLKFGQYWGRQSVYILIPMQGCEEALTEYIQENLLIVATVAITFVVAEVHMLTQCAYDVCVHMMTYKTKLDYADK